MRGTMSPHELDMELENPLPHGAKRPVSPKVVQEEMRMFRAASQVLQPGG